MPENPKRLFLAENQETLLIKAAIRFAVVVIGAFSPSNRGPDYPADTSTRMVSGPNTIFEVADEKENVAVFGYPGSRTGAAGYP